MAIELVILCLWLRLKYAKSNDATSAADFSDVDIDIGSAIHCVKRWHGRRQIGPPARRRKIIGGANALLPYHSRNGKL